MHPLVDLRVKGVSSVDSDTNSSLKTKACGFKSLLYCVPALRLRQVVSEQGVL